MFYSIFQSALLDSLLMRSGVQGVPGAHQSQLGLMTNKKLKILETRDVKADYSGNIEDLRPRQRGLPQDTEPSMGSKPGTGNTATDWADST